MHFIQFFYIIIFIKILYYNLLICLGAPRFVEGD